MSITKGSIKKFVGVALVAMISLSSVVYAYNTNRDSRLVLPDGYAWVDAAGGSGMIFRADGTHLHINNHSGAWAYSNLEYPNTWYTNPRNTSVVIVDGEGMDEAMTYTVTNTTLTFDGNWVLTRTAVRIQ